MGGSQIDQRILAGRVAGRADLLDIRLLKSEATQERFAKPGSSLSFTFEAAPRASLQSDENLMSVEVDYVLNMHEADDPEINSDGPSLARLTFSYAALFHVQQDGEPFTDAEVGSFAETTGSFALYPYAREFVQDMTGRLGLPPLTLSLFKPELENE